MSSSGQNVDTSSSAHTSTPPLHRGKIDITWNYVVEKFIDGKKVICCLYCEKVSTGGGINRMKQHLAGKKCEIRPSQKVTPDVRYQMEQSIKEIVEKRTETQEKFIAENQYGSHATEMGDLDDYDEIEEIRNQEHRGKSTQPSAGKGKAQPSQSTKIKHPSKVGDYFAPRFAPRSQPTIKSVLANDVDADEEPIEDLEVDDDIDFSTFE
ncbi:hypothetical protein Salat_1420700 [Sesamum alatum]|uniref:BED-type domain-containing protein n=1 Tax=Sesamum alatum TaxID=300844 RepID=A0AAE1YA80_9LAMI|nr:hypothetical protein Salat_1420700 [Sesamum alatum]